MGLTAKQEQKLLLRIRHLRASGMTLDAMRAQQAYDAGEMPDPSLMGEAGGVKADMPLKANVDLTPPPRTGKGSGKAVWVKFAAKVTETDAEVLSRMDRGDIIKMLEAKGNIPTK